MGSKIYNVIIQPYPLPALYIDKILSDYELVLIIVIRSPSPSSLMQFLDGLEGLMGAEV